MSLEGPSIEDLYGDGLVNVNYFSAVIFQLCNELKQEYPKVLGKVFYTLYDQLPHLNEWRQRKFAKWFAHHITNFDLKWNWRAWITELFEEPSAVHQQFVKAVLDYCVNLSFYERVAQALPQDLHITNFMPVQPEPHFMFTAKNVDDSGKIVPADDELKLANAIIL